MSGCRHMLVLVLAWVHLQGAGAVCAQGEVFADGYRYVGSYLVTKRIKVREGETLVVALKPCMLRVFTDGITVRIHGEEAAESYTSFEIYRNDGILVGERGRDIEPLPGLQASTSIGDVLRQLTLTEDRLVLTRFPALSDAVEITYASRRIALNSQTMK